MTDYIEGRRAVEEALRAGVPIKHVLVQASPVHASDRSGGRPGRGGRDSASPSRDSRASRGQRATRSDRSPEPPSGQDTSLERLVDKLMASGARVDVVERAQLDRISAEGSSHGAHQGIVCEVPPYRYAELSDIARVGAGKESSLVLVLDHITDEGNLGAIIRTAEVVGADGVVIPSKRAAQVSVGVYKTSAGAALHLPVARVPNLVAALETLKRAGFWVAGASEHATQDIWHAPLNGRLALVAGSEGEGISRLVREKCDFLVALPQHGQVGSLNVAQATTAICYEWMRQCTLGSEASADGPSKDGAHKR